MADLLIDTSEVVHQDDLWTVRKIHSHAEAIKYGRKEWCTGRPGSGAYSATYAGRGDLFTFHKATKPRPQYQMFVSQHGYLEFRNGGNVSVDLDTFCSEHLTLKPWIESEIKPRLAVAPLFMSPGVHVREVDMSYIVPQQPRNHSIVLGTSIGPTSPTRVVTRADFDALALNTPRDQLREVLHDQAPMGTVQFVENMTEATVTTTGQIVFDSSTRKLMLYTGGCWVELGLQPPPGYHLPDA